MPAPPTTLDPRSAAYLANREGMQALLDEVLAAQEQAAAGGGEKYVAAAP